MGSKSKSIELQKLLLKNLSPKSLTDINKYAQQSVMGDEKKKETYEEKKDEDGNVTEKKTVEEKEDD